MAEPSQSRISTNPTPSSRNREPNLIYHYTNTSGLMGIIRGRELWASDVRYMNDMREATYAFDRIGEIFGAEDSGENPFSSLSRRVGKLFEAASQAGGVGYIACLSENPDQLSQWRAYSSGRGFAIGFDLQLLRQFNSNGGGNTRIERVLYDDSAQRDALKEVARKIDEDDPGTFGVFSEVMSAALFFKNPAFSEEAEFRIYTFPPGERGVKFRDSALGITPYVTIPLSGADAVGSAVREIVIGPQPLACETQNTLKKFLKSEELTDVEVIFSKIPLRT
jgi:Protein of unknown function (DUF2971)